MSRKSQQHGHTAEGVDGRNMARVEVMAGVCGMNCTIRAAGGEQYGPVLLEITSDCQWVSSLAEELGGVHPLEEISHRGQGPKTLRLAARHLPHAACPVPAAIIKAVEVAAGLALPTNALIKVIQEE